MPDMANNLDTWASRPSLNIHREGASLIVGCESTEDAHRLLGFLGAHDHATISHDGSRVIIECESIGHAQCLLTFVGAINEWLDLN